MDVPIIFGGVNCEGEMGITLMSLFPQIDFVCSGDGDIAFIDFVTWLMQKKTLPKINGILTRGSSPLEINLTNPVMCLDDLPIPNFDDYFETIQKMGIENDVSTKLVMETSRGSLVGRIVPLHILWP